MLLHLLFANILVHLNHLVVVGSTSITTLNKSFMEKKYFKNFHMKKFV